MLKLFLVGLLFLLVLVSIVLKASYSLIPTLEVKRRARNDNPGASKLYRAVVYQRELSLLLWLVIGLSASAIFIVLARSLPIWASFMVISLLIWLSLIVSRLGSTSFAQSVAAWFAPAIATIVSIVRPLLKLIIKGLDKFRPTLSSTRLYQIDDLIELIDRQANDRDNRIPADRLLMASKALTFGDISVKDVMTPKRMMVTVSISDTIGPLLMEELHKSGHSRFPVVDKKPDHIVGTLYLKDVLNIRDGGLVSDAMKKGAFFVHEDHPLDQVFHAFIKTRHHLFIVVNKFEEVVGIITIEDVLEQIIGKRIVDEFDQYDDLRAVAKNLAHNEHNQKSTEVIE